MSLIELLDDYHIQYQTTANAMSHGWVNINCPKPLCNDNKYHGGINTNRGYYHCWKCGGSSLNYIIQLLLKISKKDAQELLLKYQGESFSHTPSLISQGVSNLEMIGDSLKPLHKRYLKERGFKYKEIIDKYNVTGTLTHPGWSFRLIIPIYQSKRLISYIGRDVTGKNGLRYKVLSPEKSVIHYKQTLYNEQNIIGNRIGVVEGIFDQWKMGTNFIATYGTALTPMQIKLLSKYKTVFFLYDSDAINKAKKYACELSMLNANIDIEYIDLELGGKDPGDLNESEIQYIRKELNFSI